MISKFVAINDICVFCEKEGENLSHFLFECKFVSEFWENLANDLFTIMNTTYVFDMKDIICYYCNDNKTTVVVLFLLPNTSYTNKNSKILYQNYTFF